jgi:4-hydroxy-tetrahydrodipicolinate reductase
MTQLTSVAVLGASGRMGSEAVKAIDAAEDLQLVAALGRDDSLEDLVAAGAQVVVDLTVPESTEQNVTFAVERGIHAVVGTTGWDGERLHRLQDLLGQNPRVGVLIAPNFALGSVLATAFAARAAKYFESVELIELHSSPKPGRKPVLRQAPMPPVHRGTAPGAVTLMVYGFIRCGCAVWWRTRRSSSAGSGSS